MADARILVAAGLKTSRKKRSKRLSNLSADLTMSTDVKEPWPQSHALD